MSAATPSDSGLDYFRLAGWLGMETKLVGFNFGPGASLRFGYDDLYRVGNIHAAVRESATQKARACTGQIVDVTKERRRRGVLLRKRER
jgi:hypothetical protein